MAGTKTAKGFKARCPICFSDDENSLVLDLHELESITCTACDTTFSVEHAVSKAREALEQWEKIRRWVAAGEAMAAE